MNRGSSPEKPDDAIAHADVAGTSNPAVSGWAPTAGASGAVAVGLTSTAESRPTIPVAKMLTRVIEGYLLGDLESMATEIQPKEMGAVGYPMVMSVLSGSELLGAMTSDASQTNRIQIYWRTYMAKVDPRYRDLGEIASELARNGIAHSYLSHLGVLVVRGQPARHLSLYRGEVIFDCLELYAHFRESYIAHARRDILEDRVNVQRRVDALVQRDHLKARKVARLSPERFPRVSLFTDPPPPPASGADIAIP